MEGDIKVGLIAIVLGLGFIILQLNNANRQLKQINDIQISSKIHKSPKHIILPQFQKKDKK